MNLSIIIPTYNEEDNIQDLLTHLQSGIANVDGEHEIMVVDAKSEDNTAALVQKMNVKCLSCEQKGRAAQMNHGAKLASGDMLYFVHADSKPPLSFVSDIHGAVNNGYESGCYRYQFDSEYPLLKINAYCTRFDLPMCRGGDQTLFITKKLFYQLDGFKDEYLIMEDYDLIERIRQKASFKIIPKNAQVSARKYKENGYFTVQIANLIVFSMYAFGCSQQSMIAMYKRLIYYPK